MSAWVELGRTWEELVSSSLSECPHPNGLMIPGGLPIASLARIWESWESLGGAFWESLGGAMKAGCVAKTETAMWAASGATMGLGTAWRCDGSTEC